MDPIVISKTDKYTFREPIQFDVNVYTDDECTIYELYNQDLDLHVYADSQQEFVSSLDEEIDDLSYLYNKYKNELSDDSIVYCEKLLTRIA